MTKKKISMVDDKMRKAYYLGCDGVGTIEKVSVEIKDPDLIEKSKELQAKLQEFYEILEKKYIWD